MAHLRFMQGIRNLVHITQPFICERIYLHLIKVEFSHKKISICTLKQFRETLGGSVVLNSFMLQTMSPVNNYLKPLKSNNVKRITIAFNQNVF